MIRSFQHSHGITNRRQGRGGGNQRLVNVPALNWSDATDKHRRCDRWMSSCLPTRQRQSAAWISIPAFNPVHRCSPCCNAFSLDVWPSNVTFKNGWNVQSPNSSRKNVLKSASVFNYTDLLNELIGVYLNQQRSLRLVERRESEWTRGKQG